MKDAKYFIQDSEADRARLLEQDEVMTVSLPLLPQGALLTEGTVLDLACGPGGWAVEVANQYPSATIIGVDIRLAMVESARELARDRQKRNAHFELMDITASFDRWPMNLFEGINGRFLGSFLLREQWQLLVRSCFSRTRTGGWIRFCEYDTWNFPQSPYLDELNRRTALALWKAGKNFSDRTYHYGQELSTILASAGYQRIQSELVRADISRGQPLYEGMKVSMLMAAHLLQEFWLRTGVMRTDEFQMLVTGAQRELEKEDFRGYINVSTVYGWRVDTSSGEFPGE